ncbi:MAG: hypothetical protein N2745_05160 [Syntrophorhabdaceae bacterium]|nr:hypothetical protein [Syntrophorhabdaceae bacterium]
MDRELMEEERKIRRLRFTVDFALRYIKTQNITYEEAMMIVEGVKKHALRSFPDKEEAFEIIYMPRFRRALNEKFKRA